MHERRRSKTGLCSENWVLFIAIERRFGAVAHVPHPNGSAYTAHETVQYAQAVDLIACFTPVHSPESNGMAERSSKVSSEINVFFRARPDSPTVLEQLAAWFANYNEVRPHRGLRMCSPRQFIRAQFLTAKCPVYMSGLMWAPPRYKSWTP
jgi:transposase InsO family protein